MSSGATADKTKNLKHFCFRFLAERWGFEPQNAFDTLHDFQSCALDQLSHLSIFGCTPQRHTIIPERTAFVKDFLKKMGFFQNDISVQAKNGKKFRDAAKALDEAVEPDYDEAGEYCGGKSLRPQSGIKKEDAFL